MRTRRETNVVVKMRWTLFGLPVRAFEFNPNRMPSNRSTVKYLSNRFRLCIYHSREKAGSCLKPLIHVTPNLQRRNMYHTRYIGMGNLVSWHGVEELDPCPFCIYVTKWYYECLCHVQNSNSVPCHNCHKNNMGCAPSKPEAQLVDTRLLEARTDNTDTWDADFRLPSKDRQVPRNDGRANNNGGKNADTKASVSQVPRCLALHPRVVIDVCCALYDVFSFSLTDSDRCLK